jgi:hypothetical protein
MFYIVFIFLAWHLVNINQKVRILKLTAMKKMIFTPLLALLFAGWSTVTAQNRPEEYLSLPGDNLNLYAVMNLFQNSETLEGFERSLNEPNTMINNLDLNGDNQVDYIMVLDYVEGNTHTIVLRVALNQYEHQDVAVFTVQKFRDGTAQVQLIGDEALYGRNYIIEPNYAETPNPGYRGNVVHQRPPNNTVVRTTYYEVATWPVIVYISRPTYVVYRSRWHWGYHPVWWNPWRPHYWHYYYGYHYNWHTHYYTYYRPWRHHRTVVYHNHYYTNVRHTSNTVIVNVNKGNYKHTYSRPETRRDGEVLYTQRHSTGSTVPNRGNNTTTNQVRQSSRTTPENNSGVARTDNQRRVSGTENVGQRSGNANIQDSNTPRRQATIENNRGRQTRGEAIQNNNTPRREAAASPARTESQGGNTSVRRSTAAPQRNTSPAEREVTNTQRRNSNFNNTPAPVQRNQVAPSSRNESRTVAPSNNQRKTAQPARSATRDEPASVSRRNDNPPAAVQRSAPASTPRQSAPSVRSSEPSSRSRNTGAAVQRSSSSSERSSPAPQRSSSSESSTSRRGSGR